MKHRTFEFLSGILLALAVSPVWWVALFFLLYIYIRKFPQPIIRIHPYLILLVITVSASALAGAVLMLIWTGTYHNSHIGSRLLDIGALTGRILVVGIVLRSMVEWKIYRKSRFWHGVLLMVIIHGIVMTVQTFTDIHAGYARGFQPHSSLAGLFGAVSMASPVGHFSGVSLALSHSRSYILSTFLTGLWLRNWRLLLCASVALGIVWMVNSDRVMWHVAPLNRLDGSISESLQSHIFYTPAPFQWWGYGYSHFNESTGFGMPHNIGVLIWYEFGIFSVPVWLVLFWTFIKMKLWHLLPLLAAGIFTPELYERPQGVAAIALFHLSMLYAKEKKGLRWWQLS